mgnify:CR=1 FL=1
MLCEVGSIEILCGVEFLTTLPYICTFVQLARTAQANAAQCTPAMHTC